MRCLSGQTPERCKESNLLTAMSKAISCLSSSKGVAHIDACAAVYSNVNFSVAWIDRSPTWHSEPSLYQKGSKTFCKGRDVPRSPALKRSSRECLKCRTGLHADPRPESVPIHCDTLALVRLNTQHLQKDTDDNACSPSQTCAVPAVWGRNPATIATPSSVRMPCMPLVYMLRQSIQQEKQDRQRSAQKVASAIQFKDVTPGLKRDCCPERSRLVIKLTSKAHYVSAAETATN